ncbi:hypothetical protein [Diaphorobacter nitroreducens]|uniref:hypothetical protein n=1 Tax=Diaphorobacter nitroreducens TaxID=164759 RepID=UPI00289ADEF7|nr:hypothetical protein [Diaphorobacter nitroreducens]
MSFKPSQFYEFTIAPNAAYVLQVIGEYFKIMAAGAPVDVKADWGELRGLIAGQGLESSPFQRLVVFNTSGAPNTVRIFIGDEKFIDGLQGTANIGVMPPVDVQSTVVPRAAFTNAAVNVTNASAQIKPANAGRQYMMVQNKDAAASVWLSFGAAATTANGIKIGPGGSWESGVVVPSNAVHAIGDTAGNANVVVVEG